MMQASANLNYYVSALQLAKELSMNYRKLMKGLTYVVCVCVCVCITATVIG